MSGVGLASESFRDADGRVAPGWRVAIGSMIGLGLGPSALQVMSLSVAAPHLHAAFGWSLAQISLAATILALMVTVVSPLQGLLIDRIGARRLILTSVPLFGLGYAALSWLPNNLVVFYLAWGLLPVLGIGLWPGSYAKATSSWFDKRLGFAVAVATLGIGVGAALLPPAFEAIAQTAGWRIAFLGIGLASVAIVWPVSFLLVRDRPRTVADEASAQTVSDRSGGTRTFVLLLAAFLLLGIYSVSIVFHLVGLVRAVGLTQAQGVAAQGVMGIAMILGRLLSGYLVDRIAVRLLMPTIIASTVTALIMLLVGTNLVGAMVAAALVGLLIGAEIDILGFVVKRYFGMTRYGTIYGTLFGVFQFGGAGGVYLIARARESTGDYTLSLQILIAACVGTGVLFAALGRYRYGDDVSQSSATAPPLGAVRVA